LKWFKRDEKNYKGQFAWGDLQQVNGLLLRILDEWRNELGKPCTIHAAYETAGHGTYSEHNRGDAIDCHFSGCSLWAQYQALQKVLGRYNLQNRVGIGVYFSWQSPGWHIDLRGFELTWYCVKQGEYIYDKQKAINLMKAKAGVK
jgi:hypothetical protein